MDNMWVFFILALLAEIIGTISGFGSSILFVPIASLFFDFHLVLGITAVFHVFSNLSKLFLFRTGIDRNITIKLGIPAVLSVIPGALLAAYLPVTTVELMMSALVVGVSLLMLFSNRIALLPQAKNLGLAGVLSGFIAGLIGTGGAIRGLSLVALGLEKTVFVATSAMIDLGVDASRAFVYIFYGFFTAEHLIYIPALILISTAGSWIGKLILDKTPQEWFRSIVLWVIVLTSLIQVYKVLFTR